MSLYLSNYKTKVRSAIKLFWSKRGTGNAKKPPTSEMDGFKDLVVDIVCANGLTRGNVLSPDQSVTLPGHYSATQSWDVVVVNEGRLITAIKFDFLLGPSLATGMNGMCNEILGRAMELRGTFSRKAFGGIRKPFVGYLLLLEDAPASRAPVRNVSPHFRLFPEFRETSYAERYDHLCWKLMAENLYSSAAVIVSPRSASKSGSYSEMSELTGLKSFVTTLAGHIAAEAAM
ncbi:MAG: PaeR7I family type II restriction endonuclease [Nitrospirota bacterium]|nr:PaeR7I family type II restriction endonuclease [Nitrospirota bacterium]